MIWIISAILGYLLGSIPSAVWFGKWWHNIDVREYGSGNAGATNVFRVLGKKTGFTVLIVDILKGVLAASLPRFIPQILDIELDGYEMLNMCILGGLAAVVGHLYPVFAGFKGGKGVATMLGIMLALQTVPTLISAAVFLVVWFSFHYISLASMCGGIVFPIAYIFLSANKTIPMTIVAFVLPLVLIYTHRSNIKKLMIGTENKMNPFKKKAS